MSEQKMAIGGIRMALQKLADGTIGFGELPLLKKRLRIGEKVFGLVGRLSKGVSCGWNREKKDAKQSRNKIDESCMGHFEATPGKGSSPWRICSARPFFSLCSIPSAHPLPPHSAMAPD